MREGWGRTIDRYLAESDHLRGVVQLIDARHAPTADDRTMVEFLSSLGVPVLVVATKMDKLNRGARKASLARAVRVLGVDEDQALAFSSVSGEGVEELLESLAELIGSVPAAAGGTRAAGASDDPREEERP